MSVSAQGSRPEVFAICEVEEIPRGGARAFDLAEPDGAGGQKPFRLVIARNARGDHFAYRNACPHQGVWLNVGSGKFFDDSGALLRCGRHGATFDLASGTCVSGPCQGERLQRIEVAVVTGDVCIRGVELVEEEHVWDDEDTMEITVPPG
jgi:nitrite reductase/ring-hydroxylating ferredoxin subunit